MRKSKFKPKAPFGWKSATAALMGLALVGGLAAGGVQPAQALDNGLALTPPMGWNSWNQVRCYGLNETMVKATADAMAANGMAAAGYEYVVVDDCWQGGRGTDGVLFSHPDRFPSGMKALGDYIHSKGLKFGIYGVPGTETCANFWDSYPIYGLGSLNHEQQDADTFATWGVDYLKYDWCRADETDQLKRPAAFGKMRDALKATGRNIAYGISEYGVTEPWTWGADVANLWRTTHDIAPNWGSITGIINSQAELSPYARPGAWNDPDMLQVGNGSLTADENRSHFGMWAMLAAPLFAGTDLTKLPAETVKTITNREVIGVNQDPLGKQAVRVSNANGLQVWAKPLSGGDIGVALFNTTGATATVGSTVTQVNGQGSYSVRSLWDGVDVANTSSSFSATVPSHGTAILRLTPGEKPGLPTTPSVSGQLSLAAGESGTLEVSVRNGGTAPLTGASLQFGTASGLTLPTAAVPVATVAPGSTAKVSVPVTAAATAGGSIAVPVTLTSGTSSYAFQLGVEVRLPDTAYVSDLAWISSSNGWGPLERDKAVGDKAANDGPALKLAGITYPKGLGANSPASVKVNVGAQCTTFQAVIGIDDDVKARAATDKVVPRSTFEVYADGKLVSNTTIAMDTNSPTTISVDVSGAQIIELRNALVGTANTASWHAWADWADAKLICGVVPVEPTAPATDPATTAPATTAPATTAPATTAPATTAPATTAPATTAPATTAPVTTVPATTEAGTGSTTTAAPGALVAKDVYQGNAITFKGAGFRPGEMVQGTVFSQPISLGSVQADAQGTVSIGWIVPVNFATGEHKIVLTGADSGQTLVGFFNVLSPGQSADGDLASTGANTNALWAAASLMALLGAGIVIGNRRRAGLHS
ncbi:alpha-galactosidase [Arthrobacter sp. UYCu511]|uniref:NPCBM/NEW2 domain-containing protein n=1 Tax=Arthrobacter sp. UYCu511 TaxID=3156337 RepID=UPI0033950C42